MDGDKCVGAIVCKLDRHRSTARRGYIAMLAVDQDYRRAGIGMLKSLVVQVVAEISVISLLLFFLIFVVFSVFGNVLEVIIDVQTVCKHNT
jgi:GNAT superfamily N-acetyltransferase